MKAECFLSLLVAFYPVKFLQKAYVNPMNLVYFFKKLTKFTELTGGTDEKCFADFEKIPFAA